jgi:hypothetical protein
LVDLTALAKTTKQISINLSPISESSGIAFTASLMIFDANGRNDLNIDKSTD